MKKGFLLFLLALSFLLQGYSPDLLNQDRKLEIQNRILLKVNNKTITVMDLVRKLDVFFYREYPQYAEILPAKFQFYMGSWQNVLSSMIDEELMLADAKEKKIEVTDGDVREEMESLFGPDVVINLHKAGLTYEEAMKILRDELIVQKMMQGIVRAKAKVDVHPRNMKLAYQKMSEEGDSQTLVYDLLTIAAKDLEKGKSAADEAYRFLAIEGRSLDFVIDHLNRNEIEARASEFTRMTSEISEAHRAILEKLSENGFSEPSIVQSKRDDRSIFRIFHLKKKEEKPCPLFKEVEKKIASALLDEAVSRNRIAYLEKLREHFGVTDEYLSQMIPKDFQPFRLR